MSLNQKKQKNRRVDGSIVLPAGRRRHEIGYTRRKKKKRCDRSKRPHTQASAYSLFCGHLLFVFFFSAAQFFFSWWHSIRHDALREEEELTAHCLSRICDDCNVSRAHICLTKLDIVCVCVCTVHIYIYIERERVAHILYIPDP